MSARDIFHKAVVNSLKKDGWTITHDPYPLVYGLQDMSVDLGAEKLIAAENGNRKIAVEVKSFISASLITDFYLAVGQYTIYHRAMGVTEPQRAVFLAIPIMAYEQLFNAKQIGELLFQEPRVYFMVFDPGSEEIVLWQPSPLTIIL